MKFSGNLASNNTIDLGGNKVAPLRYVCEFEKSYKNRILQDKVKNWGKLKIKGTIFNIFRALENPIKMIQTTMIGNLRGFCRLCKNFLL